MNELFTWASYKNLLPILLLAQAMVGQSLTKTCIKVYKYDSTWRTPQIRWDCIEYVKLIIVLDRCLASRQGQCGWVFLVCVGGQEIISFDLNFFY